jgi:hypothetical protein
MASEKPTVAFVLSLIAGILIMLRGGIMGMMGSFLASNGYGGYGGMMNGYNGYGAYGGYGGFGGMMGGYGFYGMMRGLGIGFAFMGLLGVVSGLIVLLSALMLHSHPMQHVTWGVVIIIFSVLSILGGMMSGLGLGLILGIVGGILAIIWKPPQAPTAHS